MALPDPYSEIRLVGLRSLRGANFWSRRPITRMDVAVGAYDEIHSAEVPGFNEALIRAFPGLWEHRCSIGERGGFVTRLRRGTYAPHIAEHVGLELQGMIGHDVGYGRARGGDREGEYTVVFEHLHAEVGLRAAALALEAVQRAFAGELEGVEHMVAELQSLAESPDVPGLTQSVLCGITGGGHRTQVREQMLKRGISDEALIVDVAPSYLLNAGLPYARSEVAVILDADPTDVPERYQEEERNLQLVSTLADAVPSGGIVVVPSREWEVQDMARKAGCRVAVFSTRERVPVRDTRVARSVAMVRDGRIVIEVGGELTDGGAVEEGEDVPAQVAAALAVHSLRELGMAKEQA
ncbi:cyanophycin synthetase family protein [Longimicrobium sp.]|jgi:cyanophycin synthetase|uniref:cyanophycin synthetase family protein n=1 Tax=Longimicrobium sp. TaxID=2029185 RepID=UPI002EDAF02B